MSTNDHLSNLRKRVAARERDDVRLLCASKIDTRLIYAMLGIQAAQSLGRLQSVLASNAANQELSTREKLCLGVVGSVWREFSDADVHESVIVDPVQSSRMIASLLLGTRWKATLASIAYSHPEVVVPAYDQIDGVAKSESLSVRDIERFYEICLGIETSNWHTLSKNLAPCQVQLIRHGYCSGPLDTRDYHTIHQALETILA